MNFKDQNNLASTLLLLNFLKTYVNKNIKFSSFFKKGPVANSVPTL